MSNWTTPSNWMSNRNTTEEDIFDDVMERTHEDQTGYVS